MGLTIGCECPYLDRHRALYHSVRDFSNLNLAIFSVSKLRLEVEVAGGNRDAFVLLDLRKDSNLTLATVLWGNVTINVLFTLLSDSVIAGVGAFVFSTIVITLFREIIPQAYFSRMR
jgi:CBS domain containing-hemolysin-like protein